MKNLFFKFFALAILVNLIIGCTNDFDQAKEDEEIKIKNYIQKNNYTDILKTESGLYYYEFEAGTGNLVQENDFISIAINGTVIEDDFNPDYADSNFTFIVGNNPMIKGIDEGVKLMKKGSKGRFIIPFNLAYYSSTAIEENFDTYVFDITINDIIKDVKKWEMENINKYLTDSINSKISDSANYIVPDSTTGFCFIPITTTDSTLALPGDYVGLKYVGSLPNGFIFDNNHQSIIYYTTLDTTKLIKGFVEGVSRMRIGEEAKLIIPSSMGYGANFYGSIIPSYSTLVFWIKLESIN